MYDYYLTSTPRRMICRLAISSFSVPDLPNFILIERKNPNVRRLKVNYYPSSTLYFFKKE
jgi:hypothetical protein